MLSPPSPVCVRFGVRVAVDYVPRFPRDAGLPSRFRTLGAAEKPQRLGP